MELLEVAKLAPDAAIVRLGASPEGLLQQQADERLAQYGSNAVAHEERKSSIRRLARTVSHGAQPFGRPAGTWSGFLETASQ